MLVCVCVLHVRVTDKKLAKAKKTTNPCSRVHHTRINEHTHAQTHPVRPKSTHSGGCYLSSGEAHEHPDVIRAVQSDEHVFGRLPYHCTRTHERTHTHTHTHTHTYTHTMSS